MRFNVILMIVLIIFTSSCDSNVSSSKTRTRSQLPANEILLTADKLGESWPLTVDTVVLGCDNSMVYIKAQGSVFAVNGMAKQKYKDIAPIWRDNPDIEGLKVDISPLISRGLKLCN